MAILLKTIFLYFLKAQNTCFVTKNCGKTYYIFAYILSKKRCNWFHKNLHNSGMVGRRKLPDPSLNRIFNALSNGVQHNALISMNLFWPEVPINRNLLVFLNWLTSGADLGYVKSVELTNIFFLWKIYIEQMCNNNKIFRRKKSY